MNGIRMRCEAALLSQSKAYWTTARTVAAIKNSRSKEKAINSTVLRDAFIFVHHATQARTQHGRRRGRHRQRERDRYPHPQFSNGCPRLQVSSHSSLSTSGLLLLASIPTHYSRTGTIEYDRATPGTRAGHDLK